MIFSTVFGSFDATKSLTTVGIMNSLKISTLTKLMVALSSINSVAFF